MNKLLIAVVATLAVNSAQATTLSAYFGADDFSTAYLSTSDTNQGIEFASESGNGIALGTITLTTGVTNYLHLLIGNGGGPAGVVGEFTLSDTNFKFANGTQSYLTSDTLKFSTTGYGIDYFTPETFGPISNFGEYGFSDPLNTYFVGVSNGGPVYYASIEIFSNAAPVPEADSYAMLLAGLGLLGLAGFARRRKTVA